MNFKLRILEQAALELEEIYNWIKERSESGAEKWLEALRNAADRILADPYLAPLAPEDEFVDYELRNFVFHTPKGRQYRALFTVIENEVRVLHLRGAGQDLTNDPGPVDDEE